MTAVKAGDVERALRSRPPGIGVLLFYGPDAGRVSERARAAAAEFAGTTDDPLRLIRLDGDEVADHPGLLVETATSFGLFGGRRAIRVRAGSRGIVPSVTALLDMALGGDTLVLIEAGDLARSAPLRTLCEKSDRALALPSYPDEQRDLSTLVGEMLGAEGLTIEPEARSLLVDALGGDRLASRGEIEKLALYMRGGTRVTPDDVEAVISDVSPSRLDGALDAAFAGQTEMLDDLLTRLWETGAAPPAILSVALRHVLQLALCRERLDAGAGLDDAMQAWRGLHFRRKDAVARQVRALSRADLDRALERLQGATLETRRLPALARPQVQTALLGIAAEVRRVRTREGAGLARRAGPGTRSGSASRRLRPGG